MATRLTKAQTVLVQEVLGYVTIPEADLYVSQHYLTNSSTRVAWESLAVEDKAVLLRNSFAAIEALPFRGSKTHYDQLGAFPRYPSTEVPQRVKDAQIANAVVLSDDEFQEDALFYDKLRTYGINSYRLGNLSETILDYSSVSGAATAGAAGVYSQDALRLLQPWLGGGFNIV